MEKINAELFGINGSPIICTINRSADADKENILQLMLLLSIYSKHL